MEIPGISRFGHLDFLEAKLLHALPQQGLSEGGKVFEDRWRGDKMIARELPHLAGKAPPAIGQQNLGFADAAGIKNDLPGRWIAGVVLVRDAEIEIAERHPDPLTAPAHMNGLALERHCLTERRGGLGRQLFLETGGECEVAGADNELAHAKFLVMACQEGV